MSESRSTYLPYITFCYVHACKIQPACAANQLSSSVRAKLHESSLFYFATTYATRMRLEQERLANEPISISFKVDCTRVQSLVWGCCGFDPIAMVDKLLRPLPWGLVATHTKQRHAYCLLCRQGRHGRGQCMYVVMKSS